MIGYGDPGGRAVEAQRPAVVSGRAPCAVAQGAGAAIAGGIRRRGAGRFIERIRRDRTTLARRDVRNTYQDCDRETIKNCANEIEHATSGPGTPKCDGERPLS